MCQIASLVFAGLSVVLFVIINKGEASLVTCPSTIQGNVLVPHQFDCSSFFLCDRSNSKPSFLLRCPKGLYFNTVDKSVACLEPTQTNCEPKLKVRHIEHSSRAAPLPPVDSPDSFRNYTVHLPNPNNCSQFYRCEGWNEPKLYECPENLQFDPTLEICDSPEEVNCLSRDCQDVPEPECPQNNDSVIHLPHPTECGSFYVCNWGNPILLKCPDNLYFNPAIGVCDWPYNVECNRCQSNTNESDQNTNGDILQ